MSMTNLETEFNSNNAVIQRLNILIDECNVFSRESVIGGPKPYFLNVWKNTLVKMYNEIYPKMSIQENKAVKELFRKFKNEKGLVIRKNTQEGLIHLLNKEVFNKKFNICQRIEQKLRFMADKKGFLMTEKKLHDDSPDEWDDE